MTSVERWWVASIGRFQNADSCNSTDASILAFAVTKRTNTPTLHAANNAIRLCRVPTDNKLKSSFEGTSRGCHMLDLRLYRGEKEGQRVGGCACTQLPVQYNVMC